MEKCNWVIDEILLERHDGDRGFPSLGSAAVDQGHNVFVTKYVPFSVQPIFNFTQLDPVPTILYGSIQFLNQVERCGILKNLGYPGAYFKKEALKFSNYCWRYPGLMLSDRWQILPYGELKRRLDADLSDGLQPPYFDDHRMFIRPDVVTKSFAGRVFDFNTAEDNPEQLSRYEHISDEELCVIAREKSIIGEYRHVICNREVIAQSQYQRDGKLDIRIDVEPDCQALAKQISREEYQPDNVYVVDTALTVDGPRIIEFNAFSCSGLYACDTNNIIKRVSEAAVREFNGEDVD